MIILPDQFKDAFIKVVNSQEMVQRIFNDWDHKKKYTKMMRNEVLPSIANSIGVKSYCHTDYYTLDGIFYENKDEEHFKGAKKDYIYATNISTAIEHEHEQGGTVVEMNKLQLFNTPLKVLITYPGTNKTAIKLLLTYKKIIEAADIYSDFTTLRKQLVIFGIREKKNIIWSFYLYTGSGDCGFDEI